MALNALRTTTAEQDDRDARAYLGEVGYEALPGFVRDEKEYEIALSQGKAITETSDERLNEEAFVLVNGIAGAVLEAGNEITRAAEAEAQASRTRTRQGRARPMTKSNFEKLTQQADVCAPAAAGRAARRRVWRDPGQGWAQRAKDRPDGAVRDGGVAGIQERG